MDEQIRKNAIQDAAQAAVTLRQYLHMKNGDVYDWVLTVERQIGRRYGGQQRNEYHTALMEAAQDKD